MSFWQRLGEKILADRPKTKYYTEEELMARLKFFIGICLALTLIGIVFVVLYSIIFVTQPLNAISPIDQKFFELIIPVATFLCGTLSGIMLAGSGQDAMRQGASLHRPGTPGLPAPGAPRPPLPTPGRPAPPVFSASTTVGGTTMSMNVPAPDYDEPAGTFGETGGDFGAPARPAPPPPPRRPVI